MILVALAAGPAAAKWDKDVVAKKIFNLLIENPRRVPVTADNDEQARKGANIALSFAGKVNSTVS